MKQPPSGFRPGQHPEILDDPIHDPYQARLKLSSPTVCSECGVLYVDGRWRWAPAPPDAATTTCPACLRIRDRQPAGYVMIDAAVAAPHHAAILALARNLEAREKREHPLQRIMAIEAPASADRSDGALLITTTDPHLARGLGEALEKTFHVHASYAFAKAEHLLRVDVNA
ncbi:MAG TPA: BCAM0308 family protein [Telluria sp.]